MRAPTDDSSSLYSTSDDAQSLCIVFMVVILSQKRMLRQQF
jgi:hypothetical protein